MVETLEDKNSLNHLSRIAQDWRASLSPNNRMGFLRAIVLGSLESSEVPTPLLRMARGSLDFGGGSRTAEIIEKPEAFFVTVREDDSLASILERFLGQES